MASVSTYLNFPGNTEEAFNFYKSVFGGEFVGGTLTRFRDGPACNEGSPVQEKDKNKIMHVALAITAGHLIMATDHLEGMGPPLVAGNNVSINISPDTRAETDKLFQALSAGGTVGMPLQDMFWGDYFGFLTDKFGINWMFACPEKKGGNK